LKTDLATEVASKEVVHRDLALVEWAFRQSKTVYLEMRPVFVRLESRTRGHALVVMLA
jgi:transposase